jgi:Domain of unknown function (DUF4349)
MRGQPVSPETLIDERFEELVASLRAETPAAPPALRERVTDVTATPASQRRFTPFRVLRIAAPAAVALSLAAAFAVGLSSALDSAPREQGAAGSGTAAPLYEGTPQQPQPAGEATAQDAARAKSAGPAPARRRAQDYSASLTLLVDGTEELSATTQRALRTTRRLGGYVVSVTYRTPEPGDGTAAVRLRVPVSRVQAAIVEFSGLGRILAQNTQISDLQQPLDELTRRIRGLERRAAQASGAERARLLEQIAALRQDRTAINRQAAFATVSLDLTTHAPPTPEATPGRVERAFDSALGILALELVAVAYALIVASPFLILLAAALLGRRAYRRHADERLLERA